MAYRIVRSTRLCLVGIRLLVDTDDDSTAKADIVLQGVLDVGHLSVASPAAQLPHQLSALCEACRTQRVALGNEAAGWVDDVLAAVRIVTCIDEFMRLAGRYQTERIVRDELVRREAVVQLNHLDVLGCDLGVLVGLRRGAPRHVGAGPLDCVRGQQARRVGGHDLGTYLDSLIHEAVFLDKVFARHDGAPCAV